MSIPLREGFVDETLERCLEDLIVRFVVNCPEEDLSSIERVLFQIEEAHWFYQDFLRTSNPLLPSMKMKQFTNRLIEQCPLIWKWGDPSEALAQFGKYKSTIPVRGCALLNSSMDKLLLVKGIESPSWGFPRGKISKGEKDLDCALRELEEETGFDASNLIDEDEFVERTIKGKNYKIFIIKGVPDDTSFIPKVRYEIVDIQWMDIKFLTKAVKTTSNYYLVGSMLKSILSYIKRMKNSESEDELKKLATVQLKKILGISGDDSKDKVQESDDPGRALLSMLQSVAKNAQIISTGTDGVPIIASPTPVPQPVPQPSITGQQQLPPGLQFPSQQQQPQLQQPQQQQPQQPIHSPFFPMPIPPNILPMQHPKMVSHPFHNPFALQMFNPFAFSNHLQSVPYNAMNHLPLPQPMNNPMASQGMSLAPSASSFSKPQFSLSNKKPDHANSKELLSLLKSKPPNKERKQSNSAELLSLLKKDPVASKTPQSPAGLIKVLKRESPISQSSKTDSIREKQPEVKEITQARKPQIARLDITEPANNSTSRDISRPLSNGKPIVLLKKSNPNSPSLNQSLINKLPDSPIMSTTVRSPQPENLKSVVEKRQGSSNSKPPVSVDMLTLLTSPKEANNADPSSQLLDVLHRKGTPLKQQSNESTMLENPSPQNSRDVNKSKELLKILKADSPLGTPQPLTASSTGTDESKQLLNLLKSKKSPSLATAAASPALPSTGSTSASTQSTSSALLNILKGPPASGKLNVNSVSNTASVNPLLGASALNTSHPPVLHSSQMKPFSDQQAQSQQAKSNSAAILELLKGPSRNVASAAPALSTGSTENSLGSIFANGFSGNAAHPQNNMVQNTPKPTYYTAATNFNSNGKATQHIADFEDFEDFDDGEIEGEYVMNGGLYDADE
ncbi:hypothetical protein PMKS-003674 [Pichia membranifaciens]|uniref:Nudix hydrolase domain-containing protein n=1 Tax=Pichia membranifaciens TaxID=4926 RepID=A0A1Q2YKT5_9ASCO|nr:hypothetical protein PMKS-003674 [Pichia membranifaciens]